MHMALGGTDARSPSSQEESGTRKMEDTGEYLGEEWPLNKKRDSTCQIKEGWAQTNVYCLSLGHESICIPQIVPLPPHLVFTISRNIALNVGTFRRKKHFAVYC